MHPPPSLLPEDILHIMENPILCLHPVEVARQMCLIDMELWQSIRAWELLNQAWTTKDKATRAPNVLNMIVRFNKGNRWVQASLLSEENPATRLAILRFFLQCMRVLSCVHSCRFD